MDFSSLTAYFDYWFFIAIMIFILSAIVSYWHYINIPILIGAGMLSAVLAVWGSDFYKIALQSTFDYFKYGGTLNNYGSLVYTIGLFSVIIMATINIFFSKRGQPTVWK